jgi:hypothetical protein
MLLLKQEHKFLPNTIESLSESEKDIAKTFANLDEIGRLKYLVSNEDQIYNIISLKPEVFEVAKTFGYKGKMSNCEYSILILNIEEEIKRYTKKEIDELKNYFKSLFDSPSTPNR